MLHRVAACIRFLSYSGLGSTGPRFMTCQTLSAIRGSDTSGSPPLLLQNLEELDEQAGLRGKPFLLFLGNGPRYQYQNPDEVMRLLKPALRGFGDCIAVFGGDTYVPEKPDLGAIMKGVKDDLGLPLLAVVGWDDVDAHVSAYVRYDSDVCEKIGRVLYGGVKEDGELVGGSAVYLSQPWIARTTAVVAISPKGFVGKQELEYVRSNTTLRVVDIVAEPRTQSH
eukprot:TRINITY_DN17536_c0_g1_i1.p1 TRINITY_DN17536_c0_g1~~TRINITY_DN17536_c0_g1_i1.p1  ORF type:complete len:224 (-),score=24.22 TRINITY_DN17536_c0_g1_i1:89-760(-)